MPYSWPARSPSGAPVVPYSGPADAELVLIGESPAGVEVERGEPFVGPSGRVLNEALTAAGLERSRIRILNVVPCRAPGDRFAAHSGDDLAWGRELLDRELARGNAKLIVPLGENPLAALMDLPEPPTWSANEVGTRGRITAWRGSLVPLQHPPYDVRSYREALVPQPGPYVLPTFHPAYVVRMYQEHPWLALDLQRAARFLRGEWQWPRERTWYRSDPKRFTTFVDDMIESEHLVAFDTEMSPEHIVSVVSEDEVHVFVFGPAYRAAFERLMTSEHVLKVAHNANHDLTFTREVLRVPVAPPYVDTGGLGHIARPTLQRNLAPALSTRYTAYPYHKWLVAHDPMVYCGYDSAVAYDAYWQAINEIMARGLLDVADHDHQLFRHLLEMQRVGVLVDEPRRQQLLEGLRADERQRRENIQLIARPIIADGLQRFRKPHLFVQQRQCACCGGGSISAQHCWRCGGLPAKPERRADYGPLGLEGKWTVAAARDSLPVCRACGGAGRRDVWPPFNPESDDQVGDVLYRGLGIRPRRYKGNETVRLDQLESLAVTYPLVAALIALGSVRERREVLERLQPDLDGRLHSVFDPWGTVSGRVACRRGLVQAGTALQNLQKPERAVLRADDSCVLFAPDMAQIEGRCVAVITQDDGLWRAYREPVDWPGHPKHGVIDSHTVVQQMVEKLGVSITRDQSKRTSYAGFYGVTAAQLAVELTAEAVRHGGSRVTTAEAAAILEALFRAFPGLVRWHESDVAEVRETRRLRSPTGRVFEWADRIMRVVRRRGESRLEVAEKTMKEIWSRKPQDMAAWVLATGLGQLRQHAADIITPIIHVHDELVLLVREQAVDVAREAIHEHMTVRLWDMDFPVDVGDPAPNWACAKGVHHGAPTCSYCGQLV